jgi:acyl-CoA synthetase (AMP-forming)/AMP-acid ligase II
VLASTTTSTLPWIDGLRDHGEAVALHTPAGAVTYRVLADRVDDLAGQLRGERRLVHVQARSIAESVVALLAAHAAGHVVLLTAPGPSSARVREAYEPEIVLTSTGAAEIRSQSAAHDLHPDLAMLMSTSGSTGSAKLVRLSADNLSANAAQITDALDIRATDCAALTLPLSYCYGLSVLTTHLLAGASVLLTDLSVVDECFWASARSAGVTTFPGVPHTFELLERSGFASRSLPTLRYLTQAGGRMDPERVRRFAELGQRQGWELVVMYGQCEATARMTYLPPDLAASRPDTVGLPVSGGSVRIDDGEVVFTGPNVMLGYAHEPAHLALGRSVAELRTGDLGELTQEGLLRIVGRRARFVKVLGHRVDLDALERRLREHRSEVRCAGRDGRVVIAGTGLQTAPARERLRRVGTREMGLPADAVRVVHVAEMPALENGKPDYPAILALGEAGTGGLDGAGAAGTRGCGGVAGLYAELLGVEVAPDSTFAGLGGDSLSYVEVSVRLEDLLGELPLAWHVMTVHELEARRAVTQDRGRRWWQVVESSILLRALAIVLIVGTHADLLGLQGTANALLVLAGYQAARFQLADPDRRRRARRLLGSAARIALPALAVIVAAELLLGRYEPRNLLLLNWVFGEEQLGPPWRFWFIEALIFALLVIASLTRSATVETLDRRFPLAFPVTLMTAALVAFRMPLFDLPVPRMHGSALVVLHLVLLGWALARVRNLPQRLFMTSVVVVVVMTFSGNPWRDGLTAGVVLTLLWVPRMPAPTVVLPVVKVLAAASLYIYVSHWHVLELLWERPLLATGASLAGGAAYWWLWTGPLTAGWNRVRDHAAGWTLRGRARREQARARRTGCIERPVESCVRDAR